MRSSRRIVPSLESMESKALLTATGGGAVVAPMTAGHPMRLIGVIHGQYTSPMTNPDAGARFNLSGSGLIRPLGHATANGGVGTVGFIRGGHAGGTITLVQPRGSVTLTLTAPPQNGPAKLPYQFRFTSTAAPAPSGGPPGTGTARLVLGDSGGRTGIGGYDLTILGDLVKGH